MVKFLKTGRVVVVLNGRYAGRKAVILKTFEGSAVRRFPHALLAGIDKYPLKITNAMSKKKVARRSRIKPFIKLVNMNHFLPTRYSFNIDTSGVSAQEKLKDPAKRASMRKILKGRLQQKFRNGEGKWLFQKLRF